jgi:hypothetical protein
MAEERLYRHIVDVLLTEHESGQLPESIPENSLRQVSCAWGLYCHIHRTARAAVILMDNNMRHEANILVRVMLEHTLVLHWIIERGDDGVDALEANQAKQIKTWLKNTEDTSLALPPATANELTGTFVKIDETKATRTFKNICEQIGARDLYGVYGFESQFIHPSITTSNLYINKTGYMSLTPGTTGQPANIALIAHCLIWAERDFERLIPNPERVDSLKRLAASVEAKPTLPPYRVVPPPSPKERKRHRSGSK